MTFHLKSQKMCLGQISDQYADVYLHIEENGVHSILKANKVILAFHSPYFHRIFQSRANIQTMDLAFVGIKPVLLRGALKMMYGQNTEVADNLVERFSALLNLLEVDFEKSSGYFGLESSTAQKRIKLGPTISNLPDEHNRQENKIADETSENESCVTDMSQLQEQPLMMSSKVDITTPIISATFASTSLPIPSNAPSKIAPASTIRATTPSVTMAPTKTPITRSPGPPIAMPKADNMIETALIPLTETSESGLEEELKIIDFNIGVSSIGHHKDYVCCHCGKAVVSLVQAKLHYMDAHQNCDIEKETISEIMKYKKVAIKEIQELQECLHKGANKTLANSELRNIIENLRKHEDTLNKLSEKNMPPNLIRKRSDIIKSFTDIIAKVEQLINGEM